MITRKDLVAHIQANGCIILQLPEINNKANAIVFFNPKTKGKAYLSTPINDERVIQQHLERTCILLGIPLP